MSLIISTSEKKYELPPVGNHIARCVQIIDLGTQIDEFNGKQTEKKKTRIVWELPNETRVFKEELGEQTFLVGREFTQSNHKDSNLRKIIESWRGMPFDDSEMKEFDMTKLIGAPCMLQIMHKTSKNGKDYFIVSSVLRLSDSMESCPDQVNQSLIFDLDNFDQRKLEKLPEFIQKTIMLSTEYQALHSNGSSNVANNGEHDSQQSIDPDDSTYLRF